MIQPFLRIENWIKRWVPGFIAWPLGWLMAILIFFLAVLLLPPDGLKRFFKEIDDLPEES